MTGDDRPQPPPEVALLLRAMAKKRWKAPQLADNSSVGVDWVRAILKGWRSVGKGEPARPVRADPAVLADLAQALQISADALRRVGRSDAAEALIMLSEDSDMEHAGHIERLTKIRDDLDALITDYLSK